MEAIAFIGLIIVAITQIIKMFIPNVRGEVTILVAICVGLIIALIDVFIGVEDISIAEGISAGLTGIGLSVLANKAGGGARGDG